MNLRGIDAGVRTSHVVVFSTNPSLNGYDKARSKSFYRTLLESVGALPGVEAVGASAIRVLDDDWWGGVVTVEGEPPARDPGHPSFNLVSPGYLNALGYRSWPAAIFRRPMRIAVIVWLS